MKKQPTYQTCHVSLAHFCKGHCLMQTFLLFFKGPAISDTLQIWVHVHPCTPLTDQKKSNTPVDSQHSCTPFTDQKKSNTPVDSQHSCSTQKNTPKSILLHVVLIALLQCTWRFWHLHKYFTAVIVLLLCFYTFKRTNWPPQNRFCLTGTIDEIN